MVLRSGGWLVAVLAMTLGSVGLAWAQTPAPAPAAPAPPAAPKEEKLTEQKEGDKQKTIWEEFKLFSYIEMGATFNLNGGSEGVPGSTSNGWTNTLRFYDIDQGYTFNMAEFSIKRDPDEAFPFGMGLVLTAGQDSQKNHSIGILRDDNDAFPFRNTPWFDLQEAYISARIPIGNGPVVKVGKFVTLLGYEVIESPLNLNYSRGYLFSLAIPFTTTGGLVSYSFTDWLSAQAGLVLGWDPTLALVLAIVITSVIGLIFGALASRSFGIYFLMLTLTYAVIANLFFGSVTQFGGFSPIAGVNEYTPAFVGDIATDRDRLYYIALAVSAVVYVLIRYMTRTPFGIAFAVAHDSAKSATSSQPGAAGRCGRPGNALNAMIAFEESYLSALWRLAVAETTWSSPKATKSSGARPALPKSVASEQPMGLGERSELAASERRRHSPLPTRCPMTGAGDPQRSSSPSPS